MSNPKAQDTTNLPTSYNTLSRSLQHIRVSHVPETVPSPTPVILVTLYRPNNNNAFTETMAEELVRVFGLFGVDRRVKAIVLRGYGEKMFCAGADLDVGFSRGAGRDQDHRDSGGRVSLAIHRCPKPTIAALNGSAVGVGITMTLPCAIRVVSARAKVGFVFSRRGVVMEAASSYFLPRLIGLSRATHLVTTGAVYPAGHRLLEGLFSEVVEGGGDATVRRAVELAEEVARSTSVVSTALMRDLMGRGPGSAEEAHLLDSRVIHGLFGGRDNEEGVKSFLERRPPEFVGTLEEDAPVAWPWWRPVDTSLPLSPTKARGEEVAGAVPVRNSKAKL